MVYSIYHKVRHLCRDLTQGLLGLKVGSSVGGHPCRTVTQPGPSRGWKSPTLLRFVLLENLSLCQKEAALDLWLHFYRSTCKPQRSDPSRQASSTTSLHLLHYLPRWQKVSAVTGHVSIMQSLAHMFTHSLIHSFTNLINQSIFTKCLLDVRFCPTH